jgi:hypothetical protein
MHLLTDKSIDRDPVAELFMGTVCGFTSIKMVVFYLDTGTVLFNISSFYGTGGG